MCEAGAAGACAVEADDVRGRRDWGGRSVCKADARYRFLLPVTGLKASGCLPSETRMHVVRLRCAFRYVAHGRLKHVET